MTQHQSLPPLAPLVFSSGREQDGENAGGDLCEYPHAMNTTCLPSTLCSRTATTPTWRLLCRYPIRARRVCGNSRPTFGDRRDGSCFRPYLPVVMLPRRRRFDLNLCLRVSRAPTHGGPVYRSNTNAPRCTTPRVDHGPRLTMPCAAGRAIRHAIRVCRT